MNLDHDFFQISKLKWRPKKKESFFPGIQVKTKKLIQTSSSAQMQTRVKLLGGYIPHPPRVSAPLRVPPKWGLCPKESNRHGATGAQFEAWDPQNTGHFPELVGKNLFFCRFCSEDLCLFSPQNPRNFAHASWWKPLLFSLHSRQTFCAPQKYPSPVLLLWCRAWHH